jgi:hypothetical protein
MYFSSIININIDCEAEQEVKETEYGPDSCDEQK